MAKKKGTRKRREMTLTDWERFAWMFYDWAHSVSLRRLEVASPRYDKATVVTLGLELLVQIVCRRRCCVPLDHSPPRWSILAREVRAVLLFLTPSRAGLLSGRDGAIFPFHHPQHVLLRRVPDTRVWLPQPSHDKLSDLVQLQSAVSVLCRVIGPALFPLLWQATRPVQLERSQRLCLRPLPDLVDVTVPTPL